MGKSKITKIQSAGTKVFKRLEKKKVANNMSSKTSVVRVPTIFSSRPGSASTLDKKKHKKSGKKDSSVHGNLKSSEKISEEDSILGSV